MLKKILIKLSIVLLTFSVITSFFNYNSFAKSSQSRNSNIVTKEIVVNDYLNALKSATTGKEKKRVKKEYEDYVYKLKKKFNYNELLDEGYTVNQASLISKYNGTQDIVELFDTSLSFINWVNYYAYKNGRTSAKIHFGFDVKSLSIHNHRDVLAVAWSEGFYCKRAKDIDFSCTYKSNRSNAKLTYSADHSSHPYIDKSRYGDGTKGIKLVFDKRTSARMRLYCGWGSVNVSKDGKVSEFSTLVKYGEGVVELASPGISIGLSGLSISIGFAYNVKSRGQLLKYHHL